MAIPLHRVTIRRDKLTEFPKVVPAHEIKVLQFLFGESNVTTEEKNVRVAEILSPETEQERLEQCYGKNVIAQVFGNEPGRIRELAEKEAATVAKPARGKTNATGEA